MPLHRPPPSLLQNSLTTLLTNPLPELSGALGDLGTLLPLLIALASQNSISLPATLIFSGLFNIATGLIFGIPLPVQPMKALAASALSHCGDPTIPGLTFAGATVGTICALLAATGLLHRAATTVPVPIVKGIQLSAGFSLISSAGSSLLSSLPWLATPLLDNRLCALFLFTIHLLTTRSPHFPFALLAVTLGITFSLLHLSSSSSSTLFPTIQISLPLPILLPRFSPPALSMALSQTPLTLLNSIIAASALSSDLLPHLPTPSVTSLAYSVATMNILGSFFGSMPVCHGSGGLAAQYRFGARSGASIIILGLVKLLLGIFFGSSLLSLLRSFPHSILGVTVLAAGLELCRVGASLNKGAPDLLEQVGESRLSRAVSDEESAQRWAVMMVTAGAGLGFRSDAVGFVMGGVAHLNYRYAPRVAEWWEDSFGGSRPPVVGERRPLLG